MSTTLRPVSKISCSMLISTNSGASAWISAVLSQIQHNWSVSSCSQIEFYITSHYLTPCILIPAQIWTGPVFASVPGRSTAGSDQPWIGIGLCVWHFCNACRVGKKTDFFKYTKIRFFKYKKSGFFDLNHIFSLHVPDFLNVQQIFAVQAHKNLSCTAEMQKMWLSVANLLRYISLTQNNKSRKWKTIPSCSC